MLELVFFSSTNLFMTQFWYWHIQYRRKIPPVFCFYSFVMVFAFDAPTASDRSDSCIMHIDRKFLSLSLSLSHFGLRLGLYIYMYSLLNVAATRSRIDNTVAASKSNTVFEFESSLHRIWFSFMKLSCREQLHEKILFIRHRKKNP